MSLIEISSDGSLTVATISSPPLNLWTAELADAIDDAIDELERRPLRGLLIRAEGKNFTGGVDVNLFAQFDRARTTEAAARAAGFSQRVSALPCPTVLAAQGLCLTWGFELAMACDLLVAAGDARFGLVETVVGLSPFMGGTQRLALRVGPARAKEFVMTADLYAASTLAEWGVVSRVFDSETFEAESRAFARKLADGPTVAHAMTKRIVDVAVAEGERAADAIMPDAAGALFDTEDTMSAVATFLAEGPGHATFQGR